MIRFQTFGEISRRISTLLKVRSWKITLSCKLISPTFKETSESRLFIENIAVTLACRPLNSNRFHFAVSLYEKRIAQNGEITENGRFWVQKKGSSDARIKKRTPLFVVNYTQKWWMRHLFHMNITIGWVLGKFWKWPILGSFLADFPL